MSVLTSIRAAIVKPLNTAYLDVFYENRPEEPNGPWMRFTFIPQDQRQAEFGKDSMDIRLGMAQVDIFGKKGIGIGTVYSRAESIQSLYPRNEALVYDNIKVRVYRTEIGAILPNDTYFHVPVLLYWRTFTEKL